MYPQILRKTPDFPPERKILKGLNTRQDGASWIVSELPILETNRRKDYP